MSVMKDYANRQKVSDDPTKTDIALEVVGSVIALGMIGIFLYTLLLVGGVQ